MLDEEIVLLDLKAENQTDALEKIADALYEKGIVKDSYKNAVVNREKDYPTGLQTPIIGVAIPHTDAEHVNKSQIAVARLKDPVHFLQMGDGEDVSAKLIFMLALKEAHAQLEVLQKLVALIQDEEAVKSLLNLDDPHQITQKLIDYGL
ncbi:PTS sugar transporter subunit IIA [Pediococcus stilesii]|uniref:PTS family fructose mannitol porter component IIA n=1 Tax=Pediococcus stilesii TaxID=331679 RepID=A0A0R2KVV3_9LACO|nr:PTS sugar transporter subunit IIA [Pediococcus stilesii]KRN93504.1 PTS family fructose mannitol porter component IIA [Pediococcus stilesii]